VAGHLGNVTGGCSMLPVFATGGPSGKMILGCHPSSASMALSDARVSGTSAGWAAWW